MRAGRRPPGSCGAAGFSLVELMLVTGLVATISAMAVATTTQALQRYRTAGAARYVAGRLQRARADAVARGASVALRFSGPAGGPIAFSVFADGNHNGVRSSDIAVGVDAEVAAATDLSSFSRVSFGVISGLVSPDGDALSGDPIHFGAARMASFTASGTATSGSVYIRGGDTEQYVVRVYGDTGKTSVHAIRCRTPAMADVLVFDLGFESDRRREPRRQTVADHGVVSPIRPGIEARLLNLSAAGTHLQTTRRLPPAASCTCSWRFRHASRRSADASSTPRSAPWAERLSLQVRRSIRPAAALDRRGDGRPLRRHRVARRGGPGYLNPTRPPCESRPPRRTATPSRNELATGLARSARSASSRIVGSWGRTPGVRPAALRGVGRGSERET